MVVQIFDIILSKKYTWADNSYIDSVWIIIAAGSYKCTLTHQSVSGNICDFSHCGESVSLFPWHFFK